MTKKKFLVTGGTGFIGGALVRRLVKDGHTVRCLDNDSRGSKSRLSDLSSKIEMISGDIRDPGVVSRAVKGVDCVAHLAYINGTKFFYTKPDAILEVAVKGMMNVIDACLEHKVLDLVVASSSEVYQTPSQVPTDETAPLIVPDIMNPRYSYGGGKILSELLTINYGRHHFKRAVLFRPHNVFGAQMGWEHVIPEFSVRMVRQSKKEKKSVLPFQIQGSGNETRAFVYIDDFTDGLIQVIEKGEHLGIYHIGTQEEVSMKELAHAVADALGLKIEVQPGRAAAGGTPRRCPDIRKIQALGYEPKYTLKRALPEVVKWYRDHVDEAPEPEEPKV